MVYFYGMDITVSKNEFNQHPERYLTGAGKITLTRYNKPYMVITLTLIPATPPPQFTPPSGPTYDTLRCSVPGCGYEPYHNGKCMKHWRKV